MEGHLSQYRIFYEVAKIGNISKAAKELYISQPAISKAISKLEETLEVSLFARNSRGVKLTEEGVMLFEHISNAFESIALGEKQISRIKELQIGKLSIGVSNTLCKHILLPRLKNFISSYPHVTINIVSQSSTHSLAMIESGMIDLGLIAQPSSKKKICFKSVLDIHDIFVASPEYLNNLKLREGRNCNILEKGNIIMLDKSNATRQYIEEYIKDNNLFINRLIEVTSMDLLIEFAKIGMGIGCVIKEFISEELKMDALKEIKLQNPIPSRTIGFSFLHSNPNPILQTFIQ